MREKNRNFCRDVLVGLLLTVLMIFGFCVQGQAADSTNAAAAASGSITLVLSQTDKDGNKTVYPNVGLKLYKVGSLKGDGTMTYVTDSGFASSGVDFNSIDTADGWFSAASALAALADKSGVTAMTGTTDAQGQVVFGSLAEGMYLVMQNGNEDELEISPMLLSVPMQEDGRLNYQVTAYPKFEPKKKVKTNISVTKRIYYIDDDLNVLPLVTKGDTFKVGIYLDKEGTIPLRDDYQKDITVSGSSSGTVSWEDVPDGTYYVFELDSNGNPMTLNQEIEVSDDKSFYYNVKDPSETENNQAVVSEDSNGTVVSYVDNYFYKFPDGYYLSGLVNITKKVLVDGVETDTDETFYAGVFEDDGSGNLSLVRLVELENNGTVQVEIPFAENEEPDEKTYTVLETDADGVPLDKSSFGYEVSGEGDVTLKKSENYTDSITLTNSKETVTPTPTPTPSGTPTPSDTPTPSVTATPTVTTPPSEPDGDTPRNNTPGTSTTHPTKTGDDTPVGAWMVVVVLAAAVVVTAVVVRKKRK